MTNGRWRSPTAPSTGFCTSAGSRTRGAAAAAGLAILVKPNGRLGRLYMLAIKPFRHLIVYPAMLRQIEREWRA